MKMDLKGFHKVSKNDKSMTLRHPDGHEIQINHTILSPKMRGELEALPHVSESHPDSKQKSIKKMAEGGGAEIPEPVKEEAKIVFKTPKKPVSEMTQEEKYEAIRKRNRSNMSGETSTIDQPYYADGGEVAKELSNELDSGISETLPKEGFEKGATSNPGNVPVLGSGLEASLPEEEQQALKAADATPEAQIEQADNQVAPQTQQSEPTYNHAQAMVDAHNKAMDAHNIALKLYAASQQPQPQSQPQQPPSASSVSQVPAETAQNQQAPAETVPEQQSPSKPIGYEDLVGQAQARMNERQSFINDSKAKNDKLLQGVLENKIDPNRLYHNSSTLSQIMTGIGLALGGIGAGATGGKNLAVDAINRAIERDVDAQKADQSNKMNAYKMNLEATHNEEETRNLTINQLLTAAQGLLHKQELKNQTAKTQAELQNINQEIEQRKIQNDQNRYLMQQLKGEGSEGIAANSEEAFKRKMDTLRMLKPDFAKDLEAKYLPGVGVASVPVPEKQREKIIASKTLSKKLAELENFSRENSGTLFDPAIKARGHALANDVISAYRIATDQGVFKPSDQAFLEKSLPNDPTVFFANYRTIPAYREVRRLTDETANQIQKSYGVKSFQSSAPANSSGIVTMKGVPYKLGSDGQYHKVK